MAGTLNSEKVYGDIKIVKHKCVGHVQKRVSTLLKKVKSDAGDLLRDARAKPRTVWITKRRSWLRLNFRVPGKGEGKLQRRSMWQQKTNSTISEGGLEIKREGEGREMLKLQQLYGYDNVGGKNA